MPNVPLSKWDFWKYGRTFAFPTSKLPGNYSSLKTTLAGLYKYHTGKNYIENKFGHGIAQELANLIFNAAKKQGGYVPLLKNVNSNAVVPYFDPNGELTEEGIKSVLGAIMGGVSFSTVVNGYNFYKEYGNDLGNIILQAHDHKLYQAWMESTNRTDLLQGKIEGAYARIACPVDIEVFDSAGNLAGKVINNKADDTIDSDVIIIIDDDIKHIYLPSDTFTLKLAGTDVGTMDYTVETIDIRPVLNP